ncbi:MAG: hypothetical protein Ta2B_20340 [Termitinemataceae bacterium]|nr:MAG: hypothetical protein Ta2B_20340 [Termitinemataceae bacterium]
MKNKLKKTIFVIATLLIMFGLLGCSRQQKNHDGGFSLELPKTWKEGNYSGKDTMLTKFFQGTDVPERSYLYSNGTHGKLLITVKRIKGKEAKDLKKQLKAAEKFGKAKWVNTSDSSDGTIVYKNFKTVHKKYFYKEYLYTAIVSADKINNNFDDVYGQAYNGVLSLKFIRMK